MDELIVISSLVVAKALVKCFSCQWAPSAASVGCQWAPSAAPLLRPFDYARGRSPSRWRGRQGTSIASWVRTLTVAPHYARGRSPFDYARGRSPSRCIIWFGLRTRLKPFDYTAAARRGGARGAAQLLMCLLFSARRGGARGAAAREGDEACSALKPLSFHGPERRLTQTPRIVTRIVARGGAPTHTADSDSDSGSRRCKAQHKAHTHPHAPACTYVRRNVCAFQATYRPESPWLLSRSNTSPK